MRKIYLRNLLMCRLFPVHPREVYPVASYLATSRLL